jgi:hypothetical protein
MGLDQYAYRRKKGESKKNMEQISYWRKHNRLHGWMEARWRKKYGEKVDYSNFNCVQFRLKEDDIFALLRDISSNNLPKTEGFFFGDDSEGYYNKEDYEFCIMALDSIGKGDKIYYDSWW